MSNEPYLKILYVEDEFAHVELTQRTLEDNLRRGFVLFHAASIRSALEIMDADSDIDVVLTDLRLPDGSGLDLLKTIRERQSPPAVVLVTGQGDEEVAVAALKAGAADYLVKQSDYLHRLPIVISNAIAQNQLLRQQAAVQASEERFRRIFHASPIATCVVTLEEGQFIDANLAFVNLTGVPLEKLVGRTSVEMGFWKETKERNQFIEQLKAHGTLKEVEIQYSNVPHGPRDTLAYYELIQLGERPCVLAMFYDVTDQKKAQKALQSERDFALQVLNTMGQGLTISDESGKFEYVNPAFADMLGYPQEEMIGKRPRDFTTPEHHDLLVEERKRRITGITSTYESRLIHKNGTEVPVIVTAVPRKQDGQFVGTIAVVTDLTLRKKTEEALARQVKELTVLHAVTVAGTESNSEDEIIEKVVQITGQIYSEVCGVLLLNKAGNVLTPHPSYLGADVTNWRDGMPITKGVTGKCVTLEKAIRLGDVTQASGYLEIATGIKSELCVPIRVDRRIIGVFNVESRKPDAFDEEDEQFLVTVAGSLGTALERLRLFKEEQSRAKELNALYQATRSLTQSLQPKTIAENLLRIMDNLLDFEFASIYLLDRQNKSLVPLAASRKDLQPATRQKEEIEHPHLERWALGEGIIGWVVQNGRTIRTGDVSSEERYLPIIENIQSELCVPLISRDNVIGAINIESKQPHAYGERDENLLTALANSAAIALENATLYETELLRREQAEILQTVTASISTSLDSDTLYRIILDSLTKLVPHDSASIILERENDEMEIVAARGFREEEKVIGRRLSKSAKWQQLALNRRALIMTDAQADPRFEKWEGSEKIRGWLGIPMIAQDQVIGFINLDSHKVNAFTERDATLVQTFANSAAVALQNAKLFASVREQVQREATLLDLLRVTTSSLELDDVMFTILGHMLSLIPSDSGTIQLLEGDHLRVAAAIGFPSNQSFVGRKLPVKDFPLNRRAIESKYPAVLNSTDNNPEFIRMKEAGNVRSFLVIPLIFKGEAIGLATLDSSQPDRFTEEDAKFGFVIANHAAIALGNARLYQDALRAAERRAILHRISQDIIRFTQDSEKIYAAIHEAAGKLMPCDVFLITLKDETTDQIVSVYAVEDGRRYQPENVPAHKGFTADVIASGESLILRDESDIAKRHVMRFGSPRRVQSVVAIPMRIGGKTIGMISAQSYQPYAYGEEEQVLLEMLATHAATAIENARLFELEQRRRQEAENLRQAATAITSTLDLNNVLEDILKALKKVIRYNSASVFLLEGAWLRLAICQGFANPEELINQKFPASDELFQTVKARKRPLIIEDVKKDPRFHNWGNTTSVRGWMATPLVTRGEVIGYITLDSHEPGAYSQSISDTAMAFANQAAAAIENARLYDETQRRLQEMETINRISTSLRKTQSQDEMLETILDETLELLKAENGSVWLYDHATHTLVQRVARGVARRVKYKQLNPGEGIISHVFQTGEVYITKDLKNDPLIFKPNLEVILPGYAGACIPIKSTAGTLGALMIQMESSREITEHINLLTTLTEIVGNAIHRAELFEQSLEQVRRLTTLRDIDSAIASSTDLRVTLNILTDHALKHLRVDAVDIMLYHPELQSLTYLTSAGFNTPAPSRPLIRIGEGLAGQVVMKGRTDHVTDLKNSNDVKRDPILLREGFVTYIGVPLLVKGQIKGVFEVFHRSSLSPNAEWMQFLHTLAGQAAIAIDNAQLFDNLQRSNQELTQAYDTTLEGWARALELRDRETEGHTRRVTELTLRLARRMGISEDELVDIYRGVLLHDIGKMGVPDHILKKTGSLTEEEWDEMRRHPQYAFDLLSPIPYLRTALDIPYNHHEHWDGGGYPRGLKGEQIPLSARIFSIVDIWDALLSDRPYRKAWSRKKVLKYLKDISGTILDPRVVEAFLKMIAEDENTG